MNNPSKSQVSLNTNASELVAGIELGGTKCICTLAVGPDHVVAQRTVPTEDPDTTLSAIEGVLAEWLLEHGFRSLGIASFGPVDLDPSSSSFGSILATTKRGWADTDVAGRLSASFDVPVAFDTDVNGAAIAEMTWGSGRGLRDFAYITVGTGVGVGLVVDGKPIRGLGHCEMGHLRVPRLPDDTVASTCSFHKDCVEGLAAGPAIEAALEGQSFDSVGADHPVWDRVAHTVVCLCHALVCSTAPNRIAIGGGVFTRQPHLLSRIEPMLRDSINGYVALPSGVDYVVAPELGDQAGALGPVAMALAA